jgi:starvation-inducible DNA-binding protein
MIIGADRKDDDMYASSIGLPDNVRSSSIALLNASLADAIDLAAQLKYAHWNVHGPHFMALHLLFDDLHDEVDGHTDLIAERVAAFGGTAEATLQQAVAETALPPYPTDANTEHVHLEALARSLAAFGSKARAAIQDTAYAGDLATADIFTEISRAADKALWKIEAHFRPKRS